MSACAPCACRATAAPRAGWPPTGRHVPRPRGPGLRPARSLRASGIPPTLTPSPPLFRQIRYDDEDEDEGPQPDPLYEQGAPIPVRMHGSFPPELASIPLEDIDSFYHNQRVSISLCPLIAHNLFKTFLVRFLFTTLDIHNVRSTLKKRHYNFKNVVCY